MYIISYRCIGAINFSFKSLLTIFLQLLLFRLLPARFLSRLWGFTMSIEVPEAVRTLVYSSFVWKYSCNMTEAEVESLRHYTSLGTLFTRKLKKIARTISESKLVSSKTEEPLVANFLSKTYYTQVLATLI